MKAACLIEFNSLTDVDASTATCFLFWAKYTPAAHSSVHIILSYKRLIDGSDHCISAEHTLLGY